MSEKKKEEKNIIKDFSDLKAKLNPDALDKKPTKDMNNTNTKILDTDHSIHIPENVSESLDDDSSKINLKATAPYNFIPINDEVIKMDFNPKNESSDSFSKYHLKKNTGFITLNLESLTPIYLRGTLTKSKFEAINEIEQELNNLSKRSDAYKNKYKEKLNLVKDFFSPGSSQVRIPGSSLRGMTRTMIEIISWSKFSFYNKKRKFHYRSFADRSMDLRKEFSSRMLDEQKDNQGELLGFTQKVKAGYLEPYNNTYRIIPADETISGCSFYRVEENDVYNSRVLRNRMTIETGGQRDNNPSYFMGFKRIKFTYDTPSSHRHSQKLYYAKVNQIFQIDDSSAPSDSIEGVLVHTGWMRGRRGSLGKHLHWVIGPSSNNESLDFLPGVIENYKDDNNRVEQADLLEWLKKSADNRVPCFYLTETLIVNGKSIKKVKSFGHTGIFRLAYENCIEDFIPANHKNGDELDLSEVIFGNETNFSGRVFFEDAFVTKFKGFENVEFPKILSTPKPTTFQHYLVQKNIKPKYNTRKILQGFYGLKHYNCNDISLRGNKLYWHRKNDDDNNENLNSIWKATTSDFNESPDQYTKIVPVKPESVFTGRIRFENLSDVELGALLFALDLPPGCCHKIGMGKPLGLGSISITPMLHLSKRDERYENLFVEWSSDFKKSTDPGKTKEDFKNSFASFLLNQLKNTNNEKYTAEQLWDEEHRMKELKEMLDYENRPEVDKTKYMSMQAGDFKYRPILPKPTGVK